MFALGLANSDRFSSLQDDVDNASFFTFRRSNAHDYPSRLKSRYGIEHQPFEADITTWLWACGDLKPWFSFSIYSVLTT